MDPYVEFLKELNLIYFKNRPPVEIKWKSGRLERRFECAFCGEHLKQPIRFQDCMHRVCSLCFNDIIRSNAMSCPTCNKPISREKIMVDSEFNKEIQHLPVYCMNSLHGCEWDGLLKEYSVSFCLFVIFLTVLV